MPFINPSIMRAEFYLVALFMISAIAFVLPLMLSLVGFPLLTEVSVIGLKTLAAITMTMMLAHPFLY